GRGRAGRGRPDDRGDAPGERLDRADLREASVSSPQRFFVAPQAIENGQVRFNREQARQMMAVLRMAPGQTVTVLDNSGWQYLVALERLGPTEAVGPGRTRTLGNSEPRTKIPSYGGMLRAPMLQLLLHTGPALRVV